MTTAQANAIMRAGLGKAEYELAASITAPLYWILPTNDDKYLIRNGSAFFLDTGEALFGVTANHVIEALRKDEEGQDVIALQMGCDLPVDFSGKNQIIDFHKDIDIATFRISAEEIRSIGKTCLTGCQKSWPPSPPQQNRGVFYAGFPGVERRWLSASEISFGVAGGGGVASSVSEYDISTQIDRQLLIDVVGNGLPPENYNFGGMSGGPMLTVLEQGGLRLWSLAGVIYQGPNASGDIYKAISGLEIIKARQANLILANGTLKVASWLQDPRREPEDD
jgi:hypothetical protein